MSNLLSTDIRGEGLELSSDFFVFLRLPETKKKRGSECDAVFGGYHHFQTYARPEKLIPCYES
jgi:hypothetical protein